MTSSLGLAGLTPSSQGLHLQQQMAAKSTKKAKAKTPVSTLPVDTASLSESKMPKAALASVGKPNPVEGAEELSGMFKVLRKDNKVWFSLKPEQLNKPFFFSANVSKSIGEKRLVGSELGKSQLAEFRRAGDQIQLVALHTRNFAEPNTPQAVFVDEGFSDSLISSAPVVPGSQPEGEVLVEANALLFTDISGYQARLKNAYDTTFALDVANTHFTQVDNSANQTSFGVQTHYKAPATTTGALPSTTPVAGSLLPEFRFNFLSLPETPMKPRAADERIGHFVTTRKDYTGDEGDGIVRHVNRWRLEKKDPDAAISEPVQPITYWVAKDVPEMYREAVKEGVLEWNKAFEAIGFKNAIEVKQQVASDTFDTLDARHASIRWYTAADVGSAVGPSQVDPRSGEILDADIRMADIFGRSAKNFFMDNAPETQSHVHNHDGHMHGDHVCSYQAHAGVEQQFAQGLLQARGKTDAAQALANAYVKDVVMHEVGHTLGLRHNFKGSTVHTPEQLQDPEFTKQHGLGSTVMDYQPFNLAGPDEKQGEYVQSTLGAYDYLAIKYAYQPMDPATEKEALNEIARQTTLDPKLAYETDEAADDMDPEVSRFDLGSDPLDFAQKEIGLARELWERAQNQELPEGTSYKELTKAFTAGLSKLSRAATLATRYVGGVSLRRDRAGTGNPIYQPVAAEKQREALAQITDNFFQPDSFRFKPEFVSRLAKERFDSWGNQNIHVGQMVTRVQANVLQGLFEGNRTQRLIDNPEKLSEGTPSFPLSEMYQSVQASIWSELAQKAEISQGRRDLQREYLKVVTPLLGSESKAPGEARSMMRYLSAQLKTQIDETLQGEMSLERRAHLQDCSHTLGIALSPKS